MCEKPRSMMVFGLWICGPFPNVFRCFEQIFGSKRGAFFSTEQIRDAKQPNEETQMKTSGFCTEFGIYQLYHPSFKHSIFCFVFLGGFLLVCKQYNRLIGN